MLQPAHIGHLAMLRSLIRQGAQDGNFDRELGASSPQAEAFFAKLKRALVTGYFVEERGGKIDTVSVPGYVYWPDDRNTGAPARGIRPLPRHRRRLRTMAGGPRSGRARRRPRSLAAGGAVRDARKVRRPTSSGSSAGRSYIDALQHLLADFGFLPAGDTPRLRWFLRTDAPADVASRVRDAVEARVALN